MAKEVTIKELRKQAEELNLDGVKNQEQLFKALPVLIKLQERTASAKKNLASAIKEMTMLSEYCSEYVLDHQSVFADKHLHETQQGVMVGDIVTDDAAYHFASGYDGYIRANGDKLTQDYLCNLPKKWRTQKFSLSATGITEAGASEEELAEFGLIQKIKNVWSAVESAETSAAEDW